ncbi:HTH domain-containing protein [Colidextribacter sp. OB.20]|uniref:MarR family winged helix-turn-helix transcriptional regulator n=1 Tax=Colidextribacter sp. OB.20 TaxID=2304568 RepID=UPI00136F4A51|nr:MarR family transcriptional regulator [Colidextribacter sp. OB.20]NBI09021.1 HTH domain-containing protein [Colidextribacter sp. OB.20]
MEELTFQQFNEDYSRLYKLEDDLYRRLAKHFGLSESAFWVLYVLEMTRRPITQAEISSYLSLSKQTINSGLKQLEQGGQITLSGGPGRRKYLQLTGRGQNLAERTVRKVLELEERAFRSMSPEEQAHILALMRLHLDLMLQGSSQIFDTSQEDSLSYGDQII